MRRGLPTLHDTEPGHDVGGCIIENVPIWLAQAGQLKLQSLSAPEKAVIEKNAEFLYCFLELDEAFPSHLCCKWNAAIGADDGRPIVVNHSGCIMLFKAHNCVSYTLL
jgi:hypothetical protein